MQQVLNVQHASYVSVCMCIDNDSWKILILLSEIFWALIVHIVHFAFQYLAYQSPSDTFSLASALMLILLLIVSHA